MADEKSNPLLAMMQKHMATHAKPVESKPAVRPEDVKVQVGEPMPVKEFVESIATTPANPFLVPASQTLTGPAEPAPLTEHVTQVGGAEIKGEVVNDVFELAAIDTSGLEPKTEYEANELVLAKRLDETELMEEEWMVRATCDRVDALIKANPNLVGPPLFELRKHVKRLMITLKQRPEFDGVVLADDIHNVMRFIRSVREEALSLREVKVAKKSTREAKKTGTTIALGSESDMAKAFKAITGIGSFGKK